MAMIITLIPHFQEGVCSRFYTFRRCNSGRLLLNRDEHWFHHRRIRVGVLGTAGPVSARRRPPSARARLETAAMNDAARCGDVRRIGSVLPRYGVLMRSCRDINRR